MRTMSGAAADKRRSASACAGGAEGGEGIGGGAVTCRRQKGKKGLRDRCRLQLGRPGYKSTIIIARIGRQRTGNAVCSSCLLHIRIMSLLCVFRTCTQSS
jgi:hypothetical protein